MYKVWEAGREEGDVEEGKHIGLYLLYVLLPRSWKILLFVYKITQKEAQTMNRPVQLR